MHKRKLAWRGAVLGLVLGAGIPAGIEAATFESRPYLPEAGISTLHRGVAQETFRRDLFDGPHAGVVIGRVELFDTFPYVESRYVQVVTDPSWDRLLFGVEGTPPSAFDGTGTSLGALRDPRGLTQGHGNTVYVCDTGNDRVVILRVGTEYDRASITPVGEIADLRRPHDAAFSDGGTPFDPSDDRLYVAETGANRVVRFDLGDGTPRHSGTLGALGSGPGRFAGPVSVAVGRERGAHTNEIYVIDAHSRCVIRVEDGGDELSWTDATPHGLGRVTSVATDHWGNVYLTAPDAGRVRKYNRSLTRLADLDGRTAPTDFHPVFADVVDHVRDTHTRSGRGRSVLTESWSEQSGISMFALGVEAGNLEVVTDGDPRATFHLTDQAMVSLQWQDADGSVVRRDAAGEFAAGAVEIPLDLSGLGGDLTLRVTATSIYEEGGSHVASARVRLDGPVTPVQPTLLGNAPNPFHASTAIRFSVPAGVSGEAVVRVFDVKGRTVRLLANDVTGPGTGSIDWDGRNQAGVPVSAGVYLYRFTLAGTTLADKVLVIR